MRLEWTPSARSDLANHFYYIAATNFDAAIDQEDRITAAVERLTAYPMLGRQGRWGQTRELVVPRTPYLVIYRLLPDAVELLRIIHGAQDWPPEEGPP